MSHTPGPWNQSGLHVYTPLGRVADCPTPQQGGTFDAIDNARLITAAPDMKDVLLAWLSTPFFRRQEDWEAWVSEFRPRVEAAIAKATEGV